MEFGERLKELRRESNASEDEVAEDLGCEIDRVQKYELGNVEPSMADLKQIASYFDVSIDYLVGNTEIPDVIPRINDMEMYGYLFSRNFDKLDNSKKQRIDKAITSIIMEGLESA